MQEFKDLERDLKKAELALATAINTALPEGMSVVVIENDGNRRTYGTINHPTNGTFVNVRLNSSKRRRIIRKHYSYVWPSPSASLIPHPLSEPTP